MKKQLPLMQMGAVLMALTLLVLSGCSKSKIPYTPHTPTPGTSGKMPATQRPYQIKGKTYVPIADAQGFVQKGRASWYGKKFHGRKTSNGETYDMYAMTAAHKTLPMNTWVQVDNLDNGRSIRLRVNDRGPFVAGRIIDLSYKGAEKLGVVGPGTARVKVTALGRATAFSKKTHTPVKFKPVDYWKGNFTVQVGAFTVRANAENFKQKLSTLYVNAHLVPHEDHRGLFYRVRIGRFNRLDQAEAFGRSLMDQGKFKHAFAVAE